MTADIIQPTCNKGNGAREALTEVETASHDNGSLCWADWVLMELWRRGYKVVPLERGDCE
jgi:hypothetical protein